jgi:hypothetical protein
MVALNDLAPPTVVPAPAPVTDFSAERALKHLKVIARDPHPSGSIENARVRDYIVEQLKLQRLEPQIQRTGYRQLNERFSGGRTESETFYRLHLSQAKSSLCVLSFCPDYPLQETAGKNSAYRSGCHNLLHSRSRLQDEGTFHSEVP